LQSVVTVRQCQAVQQCHTYLLTYYPTGTLVPDSYPVGYSNNELSDNGSPTRGFDSRWGTALPTTTLGRLFTLLCLRHQAVYVGTGVNTGKVKTEKVTAGYGRDVV